MTAKPAIGRQSRNTVRRVDRPHSGIGHPRETPTRVAARDPGAGNTRQGPISIEASSYKGTHCPMEGPRPKESDQGSPQPQP